MITHFTIMGIPLPLCENPYDSGYPCIITTDSDDCDCTDCLDILRIFDSMVGPYGETACPPYRVM